MGEASSAQSVLGSTFPVSTAEGVGCKIFSAAALPASPVSETSAPANEPTPRLTWGGASDSVKDCIGGN